MKLVYRQQVNELNCYSKIPKSEHVSCTLDNLTNLDIILSVPEVQQEYTWVSPISLWNSFARFNIL